MDDFVDLSRLFYPETAGHNQIKFLLVLWAWKSQIKVFQFCSKTLDKQGGCSASHSAGERWFTEFIKPKNVKINQRHSNLAIESMNVFLLN